MNNNDAQEDSRFELVRMSAQGKVLESQRLNDAEQAMQTYVAMTKDDFGPTHGPGSYVALKDSQIELDASRLYEGNRTYRVQYGKDEGRLAFETAERAFDAAAPAQPGTPASPTLNRAEAVLNDPAAAKHPELPEAERALASHEQLAPHMELDKSDLRRLSIKRAEESKVVAEALGLNSVEPDVKREAIALDAASDAKRNAWVHKSAPAPTVVETPLQANGVESDEVFTAEQRDIRPIIPPEVEQRYLQVGSKFYHPNTPNFVAFEDKGNKLETRSNSEAVAENMVRIAEARGWDEIKVSGSETFRREVWLEAASRNMHVKGYTPAEQDLVALAKRTKSLGANAVEQEGNNFRARENGEDFRVREKPSLEAPVSAEQALNAQRAETFKRELAPEVGTSVHPELAGSYAAAAAINRKAEAEGLSPQARAIVAARVRQNIVNSIERGELPTMAKLENIEVTKAPQEERGVAR